jgi:hypothetical protein
LGWKGASAGAGGGGLCGLPTSDVDHVPTHRSLPVLCGIIVADIASTHRAIEMSTWTTNRFTDLIALTLLEFEE